jgi:hypothetical protein
MSACGGRPARPARGAVFPAAGRREAAISGAVPR